MKATIISIVNRDGALVPVVVIRDDRMSDIAIVAAEPFKVGAQMVEFESEPVLVAAALEAWSIKNGVQL